jgi:hypothetical protein
MTAVLGDIVSGSLSATGAVGPYRSFGSRPFNIFITGTFVATVEIQRSADQGATWTTFYPPDLGGTAIFNAPATFVIREPDPAVLYQAAVTGYTSGTVNARLG